MKNLILLLIITFCAFTVTAQRLVWKDPVFTYDKDILQCEKQWVIMPRPDTSIAYPFGFLYVDSEEGIVFQQAGVFTVDAQKKYLPDEVILSSFKCSADINAKCHNVTEAIKLLRLNFFLA